MTKLLCGPLWKENNKWENVGCVLYSFHDYPTCVGSQGGWKPPLYVAYIARGS